MSQKTRGITLVLGLVAGLLASVVPARAQTVPPPAGFTGPTVRWVVMKDAAAAETLRQKLAAEIFALSGMTFLRNGNYLIVSGNREVVEANIPTIRLLGFLLERPRAHLLLNMRVVQISGASNDRVVESAETVRALVSAQRDAVVQTLADIEGYLTKRIHEAPPKGGQDVSQIRKIAHEVIPGLGGQESLTVPAILLLSALDRGVGARQSPTRATAAGIRLANAKGAAGGAEEIVELRARLERARDWCHAHLEQVKQGATGVVTLRAALQQIESAPPPDEDQEDTDTALPVYVARELRSSLDLAERLDPGGVRQHAERSLRELERQFELRLQSVQRLEQSVTTPKGAKGAVQELSDDFRQAVRALRGELLPRPLAFFTALQTAGGNSEVRAVQLGEMLSQYVAERRKLDGYGHRPGDGGVPDVDFVKLQSLEARLNLWLRRSSEAMAQSLDQQFYSRYNQQLRLLASRSLGQNARQQLRSESSLDEVPDLTQALLSAGRGTSIFVSNTISMVCIADKNNRVSAEVQSTLPGKQTPKQRVQSASDLLNHVNQLNSTVANIPQQANLNAEISRLRNDISRKQATFADGYKEFGDKRVAHERKRLAGESAKEAEGKARSAVRQTRETVRLAREAVRDAVDDADRKKAEKELRQAEDAFDAAEEALQAGEQAWKAADDDLKRSENDLRTTEEVRRSAETDVQKTLSSLNEVVALQNRLLQTAQEVAQPRSEFLGSSQGSAPLGGLLGAAGSAALPLIDPMAIVKSILAEGEAVTVTDGMVLEANPTIGFDASTVTLEIRFKQHLKPSSPEGPGGPDRVVSHDIGDEQGKATVTALSYEPLVLSTLTSNISYDQKSGGMPVLRKIPGLKTLLGDLPLPVFKERTEQKGVYHCSVIILEPVVIPTIEDLYTFHQGSLAEIFPNGPPIGSVKAVSEATPPTPER